MISPWYYWENAIKTHCSDFLFSLHKNSKNLQLKATKNKYNYPHEIITTNIEIILKVTIVIVFLGFYSLHSSDWISLKVNDNKILQYLYCSNISLALRIWCSISFALFASSHLSLCLSNRKLATLSRSHYVNPKGNFSLCRTLPVPDPWLY